MSLSVNRSLDISAAFGFLVLFPGFVAYHFAIIAGWMPAFAGGLFGSASLVVAAVSLIHFAGRLQGPYGYPVLEIAFVIFCAYLAVWTVVASALIAGRSYAEPTLLESFATLSIWLAVFFVGTRFSVPTPAGRMILWAAAVTIVALFAFAMYSKNSFIGPFIMFGEDSDTAAEGASTYQGIGRSVLVTAIVIGSIQTRFWKQMLVLAATVVCLLALGSRAHLFVAILVMISLVVLQGFRRRNRGTGIVLVIVAIPVIYLTADIFLNTRAAEIFDLGGSTSWQSRLAAQDRAFQVITESPFFGSFGYHNAVSAGYAHNILSAWTEFGALAFGVYAGLMLYALSVSLKRVMFETRCSPMWLMAFQFNLTAMVLAVASEPLFASVFPALGWGCTVNALREESRAEWLRHRIYDSVLTPGASQDLSPGGRFS